MRTVRCVGVPSSSTLMEPRREGIVPSSPLRSAVVDEPRRWVRGAPRLDSIRSLLDTRPPAFLESAELIDPLTDPAAESGSLLAVEVTFEPVPDRLVEENTRPAGA